jgi:uncharacterized protein YjaZ
MPLKVIQNLGDDAVQAKLMPKITAWYEEVKQLLPALPESLQIYFFAQDDPGIMKECGVGGYAYSPEIMSLGYLLDFADKKEQMNQLKSTVFHEALHIAQNYTGSGEQTPLIECMVYEGLATVFERVVLGNSQPYGEYPDDTAVVEQWIKSIKKVKTPWNLSDYSKWGFYDEDSGEKWKLYKAGTWVIDQIIESNDSISLLELTKMSAKEILNLATSE